MSAQPTALKAYVHILSEVRQEAGHASATESSASKKAPNAGSAGDRSEQGSEASRARYELFRWQPSAQPYADVLSASGERGSSQPHVTGQICRARRPATESFWQCRAKSASARREPKPLSRRCPSTIRVARRRRTRPGAPN